MDRSNTYTQTIDGRVIERWSHENRSPWDYPDPQTHHFFLVHPRKADGPAPLCVVLHSANRTALDYLGYFFLNRKVDLGDQPSDIGVQIPDSFFALFLNSDNDEWWGSTHTLNDPTRFVNEPAPAARRVLDIVAWATATHRLDRNRIYLTGISMGGCGSLGIGLPRGDVFAAVRVQVPAGTAYAACRMGFPPAGASQAQWAAWNLSMAKARLPDPPPVVDLSAPDDAWSNDQGVLLQAARDGRLPLIVGWGPFGHTGARSPVARYPNCAAVLAWPWLEILRNEAYPVFTHASTDQRAPWSGSPGGSDESGQINAFFRWKSRADAPAELIMQLWLDDLRPEAPQESVADVTLRRLQQFRVVPDKRYAWKLIRGGQLLASGVITPDAAGLLTVPQATITAAPSELHLKPEN